MDGFKSKVFDKVRSDLAKWKAEKNFRTAAETIAKHMLAAVKKDPRVPPNNWDWEKIYHQVFKYVYLAITLSEMNLSNNWAEPEWVTNMWKDAREELVPKLVRAKGNVICEFEAGFKGVIPRKARKKTKKQIDPTLPKRPRGRPRKNVNPDRMSVGVP